MAPNFGYINPMLQGYDEYMSQKSEEVREAFGPRRERATSAERKTFNFRMEPFLRKKLLGLTEIENGVAAFENPKHAHISANEQLHYILEEFVKDYEKSYGSIPDPKDEVAITRHVRARTK